MTKTLKNRILLQSVSTLLSPIVGLKSGFDYLLECFLPSTFARITSVLPENFSSWGGCSPPRPPGSYAYESMTNKKPFKLERGCYTQATCLATLRKVEGRSTFLATHNATIAVVKWGVTREFFLATCNATFVALQVARKIASCNMAFTFKRSDILNS